MVDQLTRERPASGEARHGRTLMTALIVVVVVALVGLGTWAVMGTGTDRAAIAGDLADGFLAGASAKDGEAVAALFAEDGILHMTNWRETQGHAQIAADVNLWSPQTDNWKRVGDIVENEDGTFTFSAQGEWQGNPYAGEGKIELDGDLIARLTWAGHQPED